MTEPTSLTAHHTSGTLVPACPEGRHTEHDGLTCAETDTIIRATQDTLTAALDRAIHALTREAAHA